LLVPERRQDAGLTDSDFGILDGVAELVEYARADPGEADYMELRYLPTIIIRHTHENPRKCSVLPLRGRPDVLFFMHPVKERPPLDNYVRLAAEGPPLSPGDADKGILLLDGSWRWAESMTRAFLDVPARSLHGWRTAYPRVSKRGTDPDNGLASIEALFAAYQILGRPIAGLLDHYYWADEFLRMNDLAPSQSRFVLDLAFPPYTFIPGRTPHPVRDPGGHQFGKTLEPPPPLDPNRWQDSRAYLYGIDLFNHGYYGESHEEWEGLWRAAGRSGRLADFLKGLIKLAAAGVKVRQGQPRGVASHAAGAADLFRDTAQQLGGEDAVYLGLRLRDLIAFAEQIKCQSIDVRNDADASVKVIFTFGLHPTDEGARSVSTPRYSSPGH
jgi:pre-rRNA-processing protein TSR3